ncbi:MAG TPA: hypothetical protein VK806_00505 [Bacteroidia bacterium]|jgi:SAM-dependent methyltransferase|nr:hypothetical protein [Bacteroidia bacterium]
MKKILVGIYNAVVWKLRFQSRHLPYYFSDKRFDQVLGIDTMGINDLKEDASKYNDGTQYQSVHYKWLITIFDHLPVHEKDVFCDFGCGKGRTLFYASYRGFKSIIGIELRSSLYKIALNNLKTFKKKKATDEIVIYHGDVLEYKLPEITVYYLFNPFGVNTLRQVINNIELGLIENPRNIRIAYFYAGNKECVAYINSVKWLRSETVREGECNIYFNMIT